MLKQNGYLFFIFSLLIFACSSPQTIVETDIEKEIISEYSNQQKAELSVKAYLKNTYDTLGIYQPYGFGEVSEIIPEQVTQLAELKEMKKLLPGMKDHYGKKLDSVTIAYDTLIAKKEREIKTKKIKSFWKISHIYISQIKNDSVRAQETEFILDPNFKMYDAHVQMNAGLNDEEKKWFDFYYNQYPLFESWDDGADDQRSLEIYDFYDKKLMQTTANKGGILKQILFIIQHIKVSGEFSNQKIAEAIVKKEMLSKKVPAYQSVKFSPLKAIIKKAPDGTQELIGYSMAHSYKLSVENLMVEQALYFEFDPWLMLAGYLPLKSPYESYFEN